jgi:cystathionine gamma-synthase
MREVAGKIKLSEGRGLVAYLSPEVWYENRDHAVSEFRKEKALKEEEMKYHVADIDGIRLYLVEFPAAKMTGAIFMWQHAGVGFSTRLGEYLLAHLDSLDYLGEFPDGANPPQPSYLPEAKSHGLLRKRIAGLLMQGTVEEYPKQVQPGDVYLYQTGMAAIMRCHQSITQLRPYSVVVFGAVFRKHVLRPAIEALSDALV